MRHFLCGDFQYAILLYGFDTMTSIIASSLSPPNNNNNTNVVVYVVSSGSSSKASTKNNNAPLRRVGRNARTSSSYFTTTTTTRRRRRRRRWWNATKGDGGCDDAARVRGSERVRVASSNAEASRRSVVLQTIGAAAALMVSSGIATDAFAADMATSLPKDYTDKLRVACEKLLKSVEFERDHPSASVSERFAAADPAKQAVKDYIQTWQGRPETKDLETSMITGEVLRELARYYKKNGSQVALDVELRDDVITKLTEVLNMLPAREPTLAERVLGISNGETTKKEIRDDK